MTNNTNTLNITACDNELLIVASAWGESYLLANIKSGNEHNVNFTLTIAEGAAPTAPINLNGVNGDLTTPQNVTLPAGTYRLNIVGINWGGPTAFNVQLNENPAYKYAGSSQEPLIWTGGNPAITVG